MPVKPEDRRVVEDVFKAMEAGLDGEEKMMSLYADDAVLVEPFSGAPQTHSGKASIRIWFREAVSQCPPQMRIAVDRIDMDADRVRAEWTCTSPVFSKPMRGVDLYTIRSGQITRAEFTVTEMPPEVAGQ